MSNESYSPSDEEETVLELFKHGSGENHPWGRLNPLYIRENTDLDKGQVENALQNLRMAGWINHLNNGGLYEFVEDPRTTDISDQNEQQDEQYDQDDHSESPDTQPSDSDNDGEEDDGGLLDRFTG